MGLRAAPPGQALDIQCLFMSEMTCAQAVLDDAASAPREIARVLSERCASRVRYTSRCRATWSGELDQVPDYAPARDRPPGPGRVRGRNLRAPRRRAPPGADDRSRSAPLRAGGAGRPNWRSRLAIPVRHQLHGARDAGRDRRAARRHLPRPGGRSRRAPHRRALRRAADARRHPVRHQLRRLAAAHRHAHAPSRPSTARCASATTSIPASRSKRWSMPCSKRAGRLRRRARRSRPTTPPACKADAQPIRPLDIATAVNDLFVRTARCRSPPTSATACSPRWTSSPPPGRPRLLRHHGLRRSRRPGPAGRHRQAPAHPGRRRRLPDDRLGTRQLPPPAAGTRSCCVFNNAGWGMLQGVPAGNRLQ